MDNIRFDPRRSWQLVALVVLMSSGGFLSSAYADTFVTGSANGITCSGISDGSEAGISSIEKSCSDSSTFASQAASFAAYAMPGKLGVSVSYSISGRSDRAANNYGGRTHVYASDVEQLTIMSGPQEGSILFDIAVSGSTSASTMAPLIQFAGTATAAIDGALQTGSGADRYTSIITLAENDGANNRMLIRLPYDSGSATFSLFLSAIASCSNIMGGNGSSCVAIANAYNSATVMGGQVFDQSGVLVDGAVVMSESGFDYLAGHPEPATYLPVEVSLHTSCLAGNGRLDANLLNTSSATSLYELQFEGLSPRQRQLDFEDWGRIPITGRSDGDYAVLVTRDGETIVSETVNFNCDATVPSVSTPEVTVVSACRGGLGQVFFQLVNPTASSRSYIVEFENVPNRSTTAAEFGQSRRGTTGRPDGSYSYTVRTGSTEIDTGQVTVDCN